MEMISTAIAKVAGALVGTVLALVFLPPNGISQFIRRTLVSLLCGFLFGFWVRSYLGWGEATEHVLAGSAIAAIVAWPVMALVSAMIRARHPRDDGTPTDQR